MNKNISIILGTGFGDEGKGQCVHALSKPNDLIIRFSGGHQCGHTVITSDGRKHIFSQFGSGTLRGAATYLSQYCTIYPIALKNEYEVLKSLGVLLPEFFVHPLIMVTTPYDLAYNRALSMINGHGTCGVGFGITIQRNEDFYHLYASDLQNQYVYENKMALIKQYYVVKVAGLNMSSQITFEEELKVAMNDWEESVEFFRLFVQTAILQTIINRFGDLVFEGSQGILLDQHAGFFPHVTRSMTTSVNALEIIKTIPVFEKANLTTYYLSRCYHTRHGNGPFPEEPVELINTENESNLENDWQGMFRIARLDIELLKHAIRYDSIFNMHGAKVLVMTCFDQLKETENFLKTFKQSNIKSLVDEVIFKNTPDWS